MCKNECTSTLVRHNRWNLNKVFLDVESRKRDHNKVVQRDQVYALTPITLPLNLISRHEFNVDLDDYDRKYDRRKNEIMY